MESPRSELRLIRKIPSARRLSKSGGRCLNVIVPVLDGLLEYSWDVASDQRRIRDWSVALHSWRRPSNSNREGILSNLMVQKVVCGDAILYFDVLIRSPWRDDVCSNNGDRKRALKRNKRGL